jgi:hypothetical protein
MAFQEAVTQFGALGHATECRVEAETVALRAYVTSGCCPLVTTRAMRMRARNDLTPRRAAGLWPAHERREGLAQHAPPVGGNLGTVARVKAAVPAILCRRRGGRGANAQGSG